VRRLTWALILAAIGLQPACNELGGFGGEITRNWEFRQVSAGPWRRATVPGCVHTDLLANRLIPNPYVGANQAKLAWIESEDWEYRTYFNASGELLGRDRVELVFEGLDTYADVYLNDSLLVRADNMFRTWRIECKALVRPGANTLRIYFHSPVNEVVEAWRSLGYELPGGPRVLTRKAAYQYGWDFAPRFVTSGIWRPVRIVGWDGARIDDLWIVERGVTDERADLTARFRVESTAQRQAALEVREGGRSLARTDADLAAGENELSVDFSIDHPRLWWPNGLGTPYLYTISGIITEAGAEIDRLERRTGIRTIELVQARDAGGRSFYFKLNGLPVFMKGANYVPQDCFPPGVTRERYTWLLGCAQAAGMNMLRVWGGGVYEDDLFYDLCDELGILVWQDFMFACAMYPGDDAFLENVRTEATDNVRRLRHHPCLALWCGNNEIDEGWRHWGWQRQYGYTPADSAKIWNDYERLFLSLLPGVVAREDGARQYVPSSPAHGRAEFASLTDGDAHYWGVWHDREPIRELATRIPRFMSEFGMESFPAMSTIMRFAQPDEWRLDSSAMEAHQKAADGDEILRLYMERRYHAPEDFMSFVYVSQLVQADALQTGIEAERRAQPYCMGSLFWQLGDCWPGASWSVIDYFGNPKAGYYRAGHAMSTVLVSPEIEGDSIPVYIVSDGSDAVRGLLTVRLVDFSGNVRWAGRYPIEISRGSDVYITLDTRMLLGKADRSKVVLVTEVTEGERVLTSNFTYFVPPKDLDLPKAEVRVVLPEQPVRIPEAVGGRFIPSVVIPAGRTPPPPPPPYAVSLKTDLFAKSVYLSVPGVEGYFTDNFFDMLPDSIVTVWFVASRPVEDFGRRLKITTLADVQSESTRQ
jgi:beta-mannosidase